jgi:hypothetical protein
MHTPDPAMAQRISTAKNFFAMENDAGANSEAP